MWINSQFQRYEFFLTHIDFQQMILVACHFDFYKVCNITDNNRDCDRPDKIVGCKIDNNCRCHGNTGNESVLFYHVKSGFSQHQAYACQHSAEDARSDKIHGLSKHTTEAHDRHHNTAVENDVQSLITVIADSSSKDDTFCLQRNRCYLMCQSHAETADNKSESSRKCSKSVGK